MRRIQYKRIVKQKSGPSGLAWAFLIAAWIAVIPFFFFVLHSTNAETDVPVPVATQQIADDSVRRINLEASYRGIRDIGSLRGGEPTILIYHTHTTEAYFKTESDAYETSSAFRTNDSTANVIAVGEELKTILETQYGFCVIHDVTNHEPPKLSSAYDRSLETMLNYREEYPSIALFIDLHRDAYTETDEPCDYVIIDGEECARLMFVVGKGEKYDEKPFYTTNLSLAERITARLNAINPRLGRPVRTKTGRYNQHVSPNCLLVEVGHNANTLAQAKASMKYLAQCIALSFRSERIQPADWSLN